MKHFEQGEQLYVLTAVSNLLKLYLTRRALHVGTLVVGSELYEISWVHISLHMANPGPNLNASEIVTAIHL